MDKIDFSEQNCEYVTRVRLVGPWGRGVLVHRRGGGDPSAGGPPSLRLMQCKGEYSQGRLSEVGHGSRSFSHAIQNFPLASGGCVFLFYMPNEFFTVHWHLAGVNFTP